MTVRGDHIDLAYYQSGQENENVEIKWSFWSDSGENETH